MIRLSDWMRQARAAEKTVAEETRRILQDNPGSYVIQDEIVIPTYSDPRPETGTIRPVTVEEWHNRPASLRSDHAQWSDGRIVEDIEDRGQRGLFDVLFTNGRYCVAPGARILYVRPDQYEALKCGS